MKRQLEREETERSAERRAPMKRRLSAAPADRYEDGAPSSTTTRPCGGSAPSADHATHCATVNRSSSCKCQRRCSICGSRHKPKGLAQYRFARLRVVRAFPEDRGLRASFTYAQDQSGDSLGISGSVEPRAALRSVGEAG